MGAYDPKADGVFSAIYMQLSLKWSFGILSLNGLLLKWSFGLIGLNICRIPSTKSEENIIGSIKTGRFNFISYTLYSDFIKSYCTQCLKWYFSLWGSKL